MEAPTKRRLARVAGRLVSQRVRGLPPVAGRRVHTLILGSMPGIASLEAQEYYGHPRNAFWDVAQAVEIPRSLHYRRRCARLKHLGFALWDVLAECERAGSLDQAIRAPEANDLGGFARRASLERIWFNGQAARRWFDRLVAPAFVAVSPHVALRTFPSTSPAHTSPEKYGVWRSALLQAVEESRGRTPAEILAGRFGVR